MEKIKIGTLIKENLLISVIPSFTSYTELRI
jgi:hypothetical protein